MKKILSIVAPIYNVRPYIIPFLDSIIAECSLFKNVLEVILVDDGSTDGSEKVADDYVAKQDFITVIHKDNEGVAQARNDGLRASFGAFVWFVDSDDIIPEESIGNILKTVEEKPDTDVLIFDAFEFRKDSVLEWSHSEIHQYVESEKRAVLFAAGDLYSPIIGASVSLAAPWDKVYRREYLISNELRFNPQLKVLDDLVFNFEVFSAEGKIAYCNRKIYGYRRVNNSITNRFRPNRIEEDTEVWKVLHSLIHNWENLLGEGERDLLKQAFYLRIIKSFGISCRLQIFNKKNGLSFGRSLRKAKEVLNLKYYSEAFQNADSTKAEWKLKILIFFGKRKWAFGVFFLNLLENLGRRKRS